MRSKRVRKLEMWNNFSISYTYDGIGNLVKDSGERVIVTWNMAGKVKQAGIPGRLMNLTYNPMGQRQSKAVGNSTFYYIHDATGNVMAIYERRNDTLFVREQPIYGSSRLGIYHSDMFYRHSQPLMIPGNSRELGKRHRRAVLPAAHLLR